MTSNEKLIASNEVLMSTISDHNLVHIPLKKDQAKDQALLRNYEKLYQLPCRQFPA